MASQRRPILLFVSCLLIASCGHTPTLSEPNEPLGESFLAVAKQQTECVDAWNLLLDDWKENGGGILDSMKSTREQLAQDHKSAFARLVRKSWENQGRPASARLGSWPVEADAFREVTLALDARGYVPGRCEVPVWFDDWLYFEILEDRRQWTVRRLPEMPPHLDASDNHSATNWLYYWLFARVDSPPEHP